MAVDTGQVIRTFEALMGQPPEISESFLLAAVYARALRTDSSPRDVVDALFVAMPDTEAWPAFRVSLESALDE